MTSITNDVHIAKIRKGLLVHPSINKSNSGKTSKIPTSPNTKLKRRKLKTKVVENDIVDIAEKKEETTAQSNPVSSIAIMTNIFQENDNEDRKSEHKSKFLDDVHNIKAIDPPAGLKRKVEPNPPMFFAWPKPDQITDNNLINVMPKNAPYALDDLDVDKTGKNKIVWQTEYREMYSALPSTFYSSLHKSGSESEVKLIGSPKKAKPLEYNGAGVPSRPVKVPPSVIIPLFFAWKTDHYLTRDETDLGGKRVNIKPPDSPSNVIVKYEVNEDETSKLDTEYKNMFICAPEDFVPRENIVRREPKSPIVFFTEYKPISESADKEFIPFHIRPSAPIPSQIHFNDFVELKPNREITGTIVEETRDLFIPIHNVNNNDDEDEWVLVDSHRDVSRETDIKLVTPSKQLDASKHQVKRQKILNLNKKKDMGSITVTSCSMTPQQFIEVKKESPIKNILSEYDSKFINHFATGGNSSFTPVEKKKRAVPPKRKSSIAFGTSSSK